ncbi:MAG TPA: CapA family protein [Steroidobacteraceae bacterium]|nr:CapA family protein [Steroidobacteraceae bacterium]
MTLPTNFARRARPLMSVDLLFSGDLILDVPQPDYWLDGIAARLRDAALAIGHLEVPHTRHAPCLAGDIRAPGADPDHVPAIRRAGFHAVTLAGNHIADCGAAGIADTVAALDAAGVAHCGAGADLEAARRPCLIEGGGVRLALLSYNCVGPEEAWATPARAGCAYLRIATADGAPVTPRARLCSPVEASLDELRADVRAARAAGRLVVVAFHKGIVHTPATLAPYERTVAHAAIDAGADVVVGHHAHILRGIEIYRGKPIFHGLGNGCVVTRALSPDTDDPGRAEWARRRRELFGFSPDPAYFLAPFHPEAVNAMLACVRVEGDALSAGFVPVHVDPPGRPRLCSDQEARDVVRYVEQITRAAGLPALTTRYREGHAWIH